MTEQDLVSPPNGDDLVVAFKFATQLRLLGIQIAPASEGGLCFTPDLSPPGDEVAREWLKANADLVLAAQETIAANAATIVASAERLHQALHILKMEGLCSENYLKVSALANQLADEISWPAALLVAAAVAKETAAQAQAESAEPLRTGMYL